ncbi:hypothetical protein L7F22_000929 [Adiantum nelumboides]|nr:hypothetical protein [Adiantum nelumboides]
MQCRAVRFLEGCFQEMKINKITRKKSTKRIDSSHMLVIIAPAIHFQRFVRRMLKERLHSMMGRAISLLESLCLSLRKDNGPEQPPTTCARMAYFACLGGRPSWLDVFFLNLDNLPPPEEAVTPNATCINGEATSFKISQSNGTIASTHHWQEEGLTSES